MRTIRGKEYRSAGDMEDRGTARTRTWLWLTAPIAVLLAIAAGSELFVDGIFRGDELNFVAQAVGQDVVTLAVALPVLVVAAILSARGSDRARLVWLGSLAYVLYTYAIYAFHVRFNPLFLVYVALFGLSLYALIGSLATTDFEAVKARFASRRAARAASVFLATMTVLFYPAWLGEVVPALVSGSVPQSVIDAGTPTGAAHVLDMAWMLPAMALTAYWLWRGRAVGYALAGALLTFSALITLAIMAMMVAMNLYGQPVAAPMAAVFGVVSAIGTAMLAWYLRGMRGK
ncbi:hypothetical protein GBA65_07885 [Rubrobacter marinus]|uniref:Uncharacterized protein n=1 Tax=Rubrobacter marinus TaxID=2653852 RepID=A0A6G8PWD1_9ACTN|nr:hypothetical protein [Rubrobacter marinus]QIN78457.1 hypothetical protein GBA65_07885 [Rubrobacter marinus]